MKTLLLASLACLVVSGCGNKSNSAGANAASAAPAHKIYSLEDVSQALQSGNVVISSGTRQDAQAFFSAHPEYQVCTDNDAFSVAVIRNSKFDPKADDMYVVANYRDGKIMSMDVGPAQFSVGNLTNYCR